MSPTVADIVNRLKAAEEDLEAAFQDKRRQFGLIVEGGRASFDAGMRALHFSMRKGVLAYIRGARPAVILTAPFILAVAVPLVLLDLFVALYQAVCFPVYGLKKVRRSDYLVFDRHQLAYLNPFEKFNCLYCSYANGLLAHVAEVAAVTESYWCPLKHSRRLSAMHRHYAGFADFGDAEAWRKAMDATRAPHGSDTGG